jgi:hypothetical protein
LMALDHANESQSDINFYFETEHATG